MMIDCEQFHKSMNAQGVDFFAGVPDSLLKNYCAYLSANVEPSHHFITVNEGGAVALAAGHYLATQTVPLVYMQNSGQGNAVNPLLSLCDPEVYSIPMILLVGWRGEPNKKDEPQHIKQGRVMNDLFDAMEIPSELLVEDSDQLDDQMERMVTLAKEKQSPVVLVAQKDSFTAYNYEQPTDPELTLTREKAISTVASLIPEDAVIVATTGHISRELYTYRKVNGLSHEKDFLMVGSMGHASQIALGIANAQPERSVYCFDGDGAVLMHLGSLAITGQARCTNLKHIVFNNGVHGSVGGQPTVAFDINLPEIARSCGYKYVSSVDSDIALKISTEALIQVSVLSFLEVRVNSDSRSDLIRPSETPLENKTLFMDFLNESK